MRVMRAVANWTARSNLDEFARLCSFLEGASHLVRSEVEGRVCGGDVLFDGLDRRPVPFLQGLDGIEYHLRERRGAHKNGGAGGRDLSKDGCIHYYQISQGSRETTNNGLSSCHAAATLPGAP